MWLLRAFWGSVDSGAKGQKSGSLSSYSIGSSEKGDSGVTNRDFHFWQFAYVYGEKWPHRASPGTAYEISYQFIEGSG